MGIITHIVSFKYKESASSAERHLVASSFLALQERCLDKTTGNPYLAVTGGKDNSHEGLSAGHDVSSPSRNLTLSAVLSLADDADPLFVIAHFRSYVSR